MKSKSDLIRIIALLLLAAISAGLFSSCAELEGIGSSTSEEAADTPPAEQTPAISQTDTDTEKAPETDEVTTSAETTAEVTTEEATTSAPEPVIEPMQISEHYKICTTTEFPMIATVGGEKVDVTMRAAALRGAFDVRFIYIDAVLDGKIIFSKQYRAIGQVMATTEKTEFFALLKILDSPANSSADATFVTYSLTDAKGKFELVCADGFSATLSVSLNYNYDYKSSPIQNAVQSGHFRVFTRQIKLEEFETKYAPLCMVLDNLSDPNNEIGAYPSDKLPIYDVEKFNELQFFPNKKVQYDNYYNLTQPLLSFDTLAPMIPEGTKVDYNSAKCSAETLTIDGVNYKKICRTFTILDAAGNTCGKYTDEVSFYDLSIISFEITP
jgi:hypothetical protein